MNNQDDTNIIPQNEPAPLTTEQIEDIQNQYIDDWNLQDPFEEIPPTPIPGVDNHLRFAYNPNGLPSTFLNGETPNVIGGPFQPPHHC
jgi:hypothetical protein